MKPRDPGPRRSDDALRELLRRTDPARDVELSPHETARLRRRVVDAATAVPSRTPRLAVAAALLALAVLGVWWLGSARDVPRSEPVRAAAPIPAPPSRESPSPPDPRPGRTPEAAVPIDRQAAVPEPVPQPVAPVETRPATFEPPTTPTRPEDATVAREIRFETAGGTRLIWIFESDEPLTTTEGVT